MDASNHIAGDMEERDTFAARFLLFLGAIFILERISMAALFDFWKLIWLAGCAMVGAAFGMTLYDAIKEGGSDD